MLSVKAASRTIFWVFGITWPGIEPWSPWHLANTLPAVPIVLKTLNIRNELLKTYNLSVDRADTLNYIHFLLYDSYVSSWNEVTEVIELTLKKNPKKLILLELLGSENIVTH